MVWLTILAGAALIFVGLVLLLVLPTGLWILLAMAFIFTGILAVVLPAMVWRRQNPDEPFPTPSPSPNPTPYSSLPQAQRGGKMMAASGNVIATALSQDGRYLFVATTGNAVDAYRNNVNTWQYINTVMTPTDVTTWLECSDNGEWFIIGSSMAPSPTGSGAVSIWRAISCSTWVSQLNTQASSPVDVIGVRVAWSDGVAAYTTATGVAVLRRNSDNSWLQTHITIPSGYLAPRGLALSADGSTMAVGVTQAGDRGVILVYRNGTLSHTLFEPALGSGGEYNYGRQLALSADGAVLATTTGTETTAPYNVLPYTGRVLLYQYASNGYNAIALEPPVTQTVKTTVGTGRARTLDLTHDGKVLAVAVSNDANGAGGIALYRREGSNWIYRGTRRATDASTTSGNLGSATALSSTGVMVSSDETEMALWTFK